MATGAALRDVLQLIGDGVLVLHEPDLEHEELSGTDLDCAVAVPDPVWPLRLPEPWRLYQHARYDLGASYWVLAGADGSMVMLDVLADPLGVGRDGLALASPAVRRSSPEALRAAYLTAKRIRKNMLGVPEWERIRGLASRDDAGFTAVLTEIMGPKMAQRLRSRIEGRAPIDTAERRRARRAQQLRRVRSPRRVLAILHLGASRWIERSRFPSGYSILIVGPDGTGKSALAARLPDLTQVLFRRTKHVHWRPGVLPRPGAVAGRPPSDPQRPHDQEVHGRSITVALLAYHWLDFLLGGWLQLWPTRTRSGLVIVERGWWDLAVDPRRYRLRPMPRLVMLLGRLLPRPDLAIVLRADPDVLVARKAELARDELARQLAAWDEALPASVPRVEIDRASVEEAAVAAIDELTTSLEERAISRLGHGWTSVPRRGTPRWTFPRGGRAVAAAATQVHHPVTTRSLVASSAAERFARLGGLRLLPRATAPPRAVRVALAPHLQAGDTYALARTNHVGRHVAIVIARDGSIRSVAKIATAEDDHRSLACEADALRRFGPSLAAPVSTPEVLHAGPGILVTTAVAWRRRSRPWRLPVEVARSLGALYASGGKGRAAGPGHGDCAPWNLLRTEQGWALIDWEDARPDLPPFFDVHHYLTQGHVLLGRPAADELLSGVTGRTGWIGATIDAYADAAGLDPAGSASAFRAYLDAAEALFPPGAAGREVALAARTRLAARL